MVFNGSIAAFQADGKGSNPFTRSTGVFMKTGKLSVKSWSCVGPGGWHCFCCGPAPKHRKLFARLHKRNIYRQWDRQLKKETDEAS